MAEEKKDAGSQAAVDQVPQPKAEADKAAPREESRILHPDQTTKQPVVWCCPNPECRESNLESYYAFESDNPECPKCGIEPPYVTKRVLIHFLLRDRKGPIVGQFGLRYKIACAPVRSFIATLTNGEASTGDIRAANCPGCLKVVGDKLIRSGHDLLIKP